MVRSLEGKQNFSVKICYNSNFHGWISNAEQKHLHRVRVTKDLYSVSVLKLLLLLVS